MLKNPLIRGILHLAQLLPIVWIKWSFVLNTSKAKINKKIILEAFCGWKVYSCVTSQELQGIQPSNHLGNSAFILGFVPYCPKLSGHSLNILTYEVEVAKLWTRQ